MKQTKPLPVFYCMLYDFNKKEVVAYDIIHRLIPELESACEDVSALTREDLRNLTIRQLRWLFWSKCEYEFIVQQWPPKHDNLEGEIFTRKEAEKLMEEARCDGEKIDVFRQAMMNIEVILDILVKYYHE